MPKPVGSAQRYMPGLDGLRAIAVIAVIAYHLQLGSVQGGLLGVGVFFTLSGYLITDLLLGQRDTIRQLRLGDFWIRRARRLLPALFLMLAVVVAWATLLDRSQLSTLRGDVAAAALYVSNWWNIIRHASYFARFGPPPPLDHLWSLAVEEQFYLLWPWLLWLGLRYVRGRYWLAGLTLAGAALSATAMTLLYQPGADPTRIYEGTDTRAFGLLVGAALAMVWPSRRLGANLALPRRLLLDGAGAAGLVIIALLIWQTDQYSAFLYRGGIVLLSVATVSVVAALAHPASWLGSVVGWKPLRWLGVRSYGIYLWHWPIIVLTTPTLQRGIDLSLAVVQVVATIAIAALSWRFVEEPIRRGALGRFWAQARPGAWHQKAVPQQAVPRQAVPRRSIRRCYRRRRRLRFFAGVASVVALSVLALDGAGLAGVIGTGADSIGLQSASEKSPAHVKISTHHTVATPPPATTPAPEPTSQKLTAPPTATPAKDSSPEKAAPPTTTSCHSVAYIGDSTSEGMVMPNYIPDPSGRLGAQYARVGATSQYFEISGARSIVEKLSAHQANGEEVARGLKAKGFRGCWVIALGTNDTADVYAGSQVGLKTRIERMMSVVGDQPVLWVSVKSLLTSGPYSEANMELWNRTLVDACARYPNMRVFDWAPLAKDSWFISDGTHYTSEGYEKRARLSATALVHAFPASGSSHRCVVH